MTKSEELFRASLAHIPGGVNSPVRAFKGVGGTPIFFDRGEGAYLYDEDDQRYVDYVASYGPAILGHAHPEIVAAIRETAGKGLGFGAPSALEARMAEVLCARLPAMEKVRMVNSGTEATMSAIRLARGYTGRDRILKFEGCYHGHADALLVKAGSGALTLGVPNSPGVPAAVAQHTMTTPYNNLQAAETLFAELGDEIAAIIVEPVAGNMNCIPPANGFLSGLRKLCDQYKSLLIFDEVMTGFRVGPRCAQGLFDITPDLSTLGKVIGGGLPVGAFGGRSEIMDRLAPDGPVYQAGTLSGNPIAMAAGLATLEQIAKPEFFDQLTASTMLLIDGLLERAKAAGIALRANQVGGMFGLFFTEAKSVGNFEEVMKCDQQRFREFFHGMLREGIYFAPSAFETAFISSAHGAKELEFTWNAAERVFARLRSL